MLWPEFPLNKPCCLLKAIFILYELHHNNKTFLAFAYFFYKYLK